MGTKATDESSKTIMTPHVDKKIMIISNAISGGGAEISMMRFFETLKSLHVDVTLCAVNQDATNFGAESGITVIGRDWGTGFMGTVKSFTNFRRHLRIINPDVVLVNCELPELYIALSGTRKLQIFCVEHTSKPWVGRRRLGFIVRAILRIRRCHWVTVSRDQSRVWPYGPMPVFIPNTHFLEGSKKLQAPVDLVFVGRLNQAKHPEIAAEVAVSTLSSLDFFGDGPELNSLKLKFHSNKIKFHGFVANPWTHVSPESILIVPSDFEGDGMNIVEAVSNRNPILLADNIDLRRFDFPEINYFSSITELRSKVNHAKTFGVADFRLGEAIRLKILQERDPLEVAGQWITLIKKVSEK